jgi:2-polyprenyl-6-methoxyphenol hydroxylase-like FAD-dependent oxidoreductase
MSAHALVAGAGPAGAALAYLLASRGVRVTLFERQTDFAREFRGEVLLPGGLDALGQMGLDEAMRSVPSVDFRAIRIFRDGRQLFTVDIADADFGGALPRIVSQPAMLEMLVAQAARHEGFTLLRGATVRDLLRDGDRVCGLRVQLAGGEREFRGDCVIGADGRASLLRRRAGLRQAGQPQRFDIVWFKVPLPHEFAERPHVRGYIGRGHLLLAFPSYDGLLQAAWVIDKGAFGELRRLGIDAWVAEMANHVSPDLAAHLRAHVEEIHHPFLLDVICDRVERWSVPGLLVLGDAAHPMSPVGAQGINVALRDAIVAANHLVPVLAPGAPAAEAFDAAAQRIERERLPEVAEIQRLQQGPPRVLFQRAWWSGIALRVLPWLLRLDVLRGRGGVVFRRFAFGVTDVKLVI